MGRWREVPTLLAVSVPASFRPHLLGHPPQTYSVGRGMHPLLPRHRDVNNAYLHGTVDLTAVEHELEVVQAAQGSLPRQVLLLIDEEEGVVQRLSDG